MSRSASLFLKTIGCWLLPAVLVLAQDEIRRLPHITYPMQPTEPELSIGPGPLGPSVLIEDDDRLPLRVAQALPDASQQLLLTQQVAAQPAKLPGAKDGVLQNISFTGTWLPAPADDDLGFSDLETSISLGFPFPTVRSPLVVTPAFGVHYLDGPDSPDLPARVYDAEVQFRWIRPIGERWTADVAVTPGYYSDFEIDNPDALRITGRGFAAYKWSEELTAVLGVAYLDRTDVGILPIGGVIWTPNDYSRYELIAPRPKIAVRLPPTGCLSGNMVGSGLQRHFPDGTIIEVEPSYSDYWLYIAGEFGGGAWAIERPEGEADQIMVSDYRAILGLEHKVPGAINSRIEIGYVFGRSIEFRSGIPDYDPGDTILVRAGASY